MPNLGSSNHQVRTRSERVASIVPIRGAWEKFLGIFNNDLRFSLVVSMLVANVIICFVIEAWKPPFPFRLNDVPERNIVCRTPFRVEDLKETENKKNRARLFTQQVYTVDSQKLINTRDALINTVAGLIQTADIEEIVDPNLKNDFFPPGSAGVSPASAGGSVTLAEAGAALPGAEEFKGFFNALKNHYNSDNLAKFQESIKKSLNSFENLGFFVDPPQRSTVYAQQIKIVSPDGTVTPVYENEVLLGDGSRLMRALEAEFPHNIAQPLYNWLFPRIRKLGSTLKWDEAKTSADIEKAVEAVEIAYDDYAKGRVIAPAEKAIDSSTLYLLQKEYNEQISGLTFRQESVRFTSVFVLLVIGHFLSWVFMYRRERRKPKTFMAGFMTIFFFLLAALLGKFLIVVGQEHGHLEMLPLLIFSQSLAITFSWELAIATSLNLILVYVVAEGFRLGPMLILAGAMVAVVLQLGRLRTRSKLVTVGIIGGFVSFCLTLTIGVIEGRSLGIDSTWGTVLSGIISGDILGNELLTEAFLNGLWPIAAGFAMTGLLPYIERPFGILTDMSLLELGDVTHPLLQEMLRRAPATYSHSFQVGSIAEAACEAIGARGLLTRVGACFHDIGKIMKPHYFSENQTGENIHDSLEPRMSALVIVAHVKDGADLARQYRLPQPLIDLIEQHHGTSLVSYFYGVASRQNKENPYGTANVEESSFRYPGPKPRTKEAGVLMLADAAESGVRSMGDSATPGRIENMVRLITETKLKDGQFDECGLTLHELKTVENSIINSLIAIRHHRIKYPGQDKTVERPKTGPHSKTNFTESAMSLKADSTVVSNPEKIVK